MELRGSLTEQNLLKAFAGESLARNRYEWFAAQAEKEGFQQIAELFSETAGHELSHAKQFIKFLEGGMVEITATYPAGHLHLRTFMKRRMEKTKSGQHFILNLPVLLKKRVLEK